MCRTVKARIAADLIAKIRKAEGWPRVEGDSLRTIRKIKGLYDLSITREGYHVATRRECA